MNYFAGSSRLTDRPFSIALQITNQWSTYIDKPSEIRQNFSDYLNSYKITQAFEENLLKLIETDKAGTIINSALVFQFDKDQDYNQQTNASGTLIFIIKGITDPNTVRNATFFFQKQGAGFASIIDGDTRVKRILFLAMHEADDHNDFYRPLIASQDTTNMTVFGFGRQDPVQPSGHLLTIIPAHFTIGFVDDTTFSTVSRIVINKSEKVPVNSPFLWNRSQGANTYQFQASESSSFDSNIIDSAGIKDTVYRPGNLLDGKFYYWRVRAINNSGISEFSETRTFITKLNRI